LLVSTAKGRQPKKCAGTEGTRIKVVKGPVNRLRSKLPTYTCGKGVLVEIL
jgi:hypothetical protein